MDFLCDPVPCLGVNQCLAQKLLQLLLVPQLEQNTSGRFSSLGACSASGISTLQQSLG